MMPACTGIACSLLQRVNAPMDYFFCVAFLFGSHSCRTRIEQESSVFFMCALLLFGVFPGMKTAVRTEGQYTARAFCPILLSKWRNK